VARGNVVEGLLELVEAERRAPDNADYVDAVARTLATSPDPRIGDRSSAVRLARRAAELAPRNPMVLDTLAAAYAAQGAFGDATRASREAIEVAKAHSRGDLVEQLQAHEDLFRARRVLREQARIGKQPARPNS
jgi:cytochrome c-type biogenesis protein CcmH/NrfG